LSSFVASAEKCIEAKRVLAEQIWFQRAAWLRYTLPPCPRALSQRYPLNAYQKRRVMNGQQNQGFRVALSILIIVGATVGVWLCHLALSEYASKTQTTTRTVLAQESGENDLYQPALTFAPVATNYLPLVVRSGGFDKWSLWTGGTQLRGANIYQRRVYPELDGTEFLGDGPVGPPYVQKDFDDLAAMGANYVNISHPGLFTETAPYTLDQDIQDNLDNLLGMIEKASMFAVISFRTGPGRAEFSVCCLGDDWFPASYYNDTVWENQAAQNAWANMWRYTAGRYKDNPIVVGYDLMVEPNSNETLTGEWIDAEDFYPQYEDTLADWNQLYPDITAAIREVDANTPILIGGMGYSSLEWLPYLEPTEDSRTVYMVHHYEPFDYTHQDPPPTESYPDGSFNKTWLEEQLSTIDTFSTTHGVPVAINEFGVHRWALGGDQYMDDQMDLFEQRGTNHALWMWDPSWPPWAEIGDPDIDAFNFRYGPDYENHTNVASSDLMDAITKYWGRNTAHPSQR
jgi:hypothetical protein